jgi:hypothetical protein
VISNAGRVPGDNQLADALGAVVVELPPHRAWRHQVGELRLMAAVLSDAINVVRKRPRSRSGREARAWLASHDTDWPFSFECICDALDLNAGRIRREVAAPDAVVRLPLRVDVPMRIAG